MDFSEDEELPAAAFAQSDAHRDETKCLGTFSEDGSAGELDKLIKQSLQMNIRDICRQIEKNEELMCATSRIGATGSTASVKMSSEAITALTELTYEYVTTTLATDLIAFSQHNAKRTSINVDDVKLVLRRAPPSLRQKLDDFCIKHQMVDMKSYVGQKKANSITAPATASASARKSSAHKAGVSTAKKSKAGKGLKSQRRGSSRTSETRQSLEVSRGRVARADDKGSDDDLSTSGDDDASSSEDEDEPIVLRRSNKKGVAQSKSKGNSRNDDDDEYGEGEEDDNTDIDPIQSTSETEEEECIDLSETIGVSPITKSSTKTPSRHKAATTKSNKQSNRKTTLSKNTRKTNSKQGLESTTLSLAQADPSDRSSALRSDSSDTSSDFGDRAAPSQINKRRMPLSKTFLEDSTDTSSDDAF